MDLAVNHFTRSAVEIKIPRCPFTFLGPIPEDSVFVYEWCPSSKGSLAIHVVSSLQRGIS